MLDSSPVIQEPQASVSDPIPALTNKPFGFYFSYNSLRIDRRGSPPIILQVGPSQLMFSENCALLCRMAKVNLASVPNKPSTKAIYDAAVQLGLSSLQYLMLQSNKSLSIGQVTWDKNGIVDSQYRKSILRDETWSSIVMDSLAEELAMPIKIDNINFVPSQVLHLPK